MLALNEWYQLNSPGVVNDIVDDEVVIVNLDTGVYYSTVQSGTTVWQYIESGCTIEEITKAVIDQHTGDSTFMTQNVHAFLEQLLAEGLIVPGDGASPAADVAKATTDRKEPFEAIVFQKYVDMEDLLLLDPVHEVDDRGWPHASDHG